MPRLYDDGFDDEFDDHPIICNHGKEQAHCEDCDEEIGDIEKCLNCGRIKSASSLNEYQVCRKGCINPNEY